MCRAEEEHVYMVKTFLLDMAGLYIDCQACHQGADGMPVENKYGTVRPIRA